MIDSIDRTITTLKPKTRKRLRNARSDSYPLQSNTRSEQRYWVSTGRSDGMVNPKGCYVIKALVRDTSICVFGERLNSIEILLFKP